MYTAIALCGIPLASIAAVFVAEWWRADAAGADGRQSVVLIRRDADGADGADALEVAE